MLNPARRFRRWRRRRRYPGVFIPPGWEDGGPPSLTRVGNEIRTLHLWIRAPRDAFPYRLACELAEIAAEIDRIWPVNGG